MKKLYSLKVVPKTAFKNIHRFGIKWKYVEGHKQAPQPHYYFAGLGQTLSKYYGKKGAELVTSVRMAKRWAKLHGQVIEQVSEDVKDGFYICK